MIKLNVLRVVEDSLPIEKTLTLHNVIILIKPVLNKIKITTTIR